MMQSPLKQLGFPEPIIKKQHFQTYGEAFFRMFTTIVLAITFNVLDVLPFYESMVAWLIGYLITVLLLYVFRVPKHFLVDAEFNHLFSYFLAYVIIYTFIFNGIELFTQ